MKQFDVKFNVDTTGLGGLNYRIFWISLGAMFVVSLLMRFGIIPKINLNRTTKAKEVTVQKDESVKGYAAKGPFNQTKAYLVSDFDKNEIIFSKELHTRTPIASITKIMTAIVALDLAKPDRQITVMKGTENVLPTTIGVVPGQKIKLSELIDAMLLTSANDAAEVIRRGIGGDFVEKMNKKAKTLGLINTRFSNPQGFDSIYNYSSVYDLMLLMQTAMKYPQIRESFRKKYVFLPANEDRKQYDLYNWNGLLGVYPGVLGGKIGNTDRAGYTTIVLSERNGKKMLAVLLGAPGVLERDLWTAELLDLGFEKAYGFQPVNVTEEQLQAKYATWKYWN